MHKHEIYVPHFFRLIASVIRYFDANEFTFWSFFFGNNNKEIKEVELQEEETKFKNDEFKNKHHEAKQKTEDEAKLKNEEVKKREEEEAKQEKEEYSKKLKEKIDAMSFFSQQLKIISKTKSLGGTKPLEQP